MKISRIVHKYIGYEFPIAITIFFSIILLSLIILILFFERKFRKKYHNLIYRDELFNTLYLNINDVFLVYHQKNKKYEYISPNLERVLGISRKELSNNPQVLLQYLCKDEIASYFVEDTIPGNYEAEIQVHHPKTFQLLWIHFRIFPTMNSQLELRYICCISDITKEMKSKEELEKSFNNIKKANEAKKEFLSHMGHEMRTPISGVIGMAQMAVYSLDNRSKVKQNLDKIIESSSQLLQIVSNILDISKMDLDKMIIAKEPFCLSRLLSSLSFIVHTAAEAKKQEFELQLTDVKEDYLIGDSLRLFQIIENCVSNALKFTPIGGKIRLEVCQMERHGNKVLFSFAITDNGKGMSREFLEHIFRPFEQEDNSIAIRYGGSGLGMSIVKNLVSLMGGDIHIKSELNIGTRITINLVFEISDQKQEEDEVIFKRKDLQDYDLSGQRILVVEDNEISLEITCEFLQCMKATVVSSKNGKEALELFIASPKDHYQAILMDLQMPELNGCETAKAIRESAHPNARRICIIAMSADHCPETLAAGIDYYISKPIDIKQLYSMLKKHSDADYTGKVNSV